MKQLLVNLLTVLSIAPFGSLAEAALENRPTVLSCELRAHSRGDRPHTVADEIVYEQDPVLLNRTRQRELTIHSPELARAFGVKTDSLSVHLQADQNSTIGSTLRLSSNFNLAGLKIMTDLKKDHHNDFIQFDPAENEIYIFKANVLSLVNKGFYFRLTNPNPSGPTDAREEIGLYCALNQY